MPIHLNRSLLVFAILLVLLGFGSNFYLLSLFGVLLLIPAFLSSSRPPKMGRTPVSTKQETRRIAPPPIQHYEAAAPSVSPRAVNEIPSTTPSSTFAPALFPTSMFPFLSQTVYRPEPTRETAEEKVNQRDDVLEIGTILALLRLALG